MYIKFLEGRPLASEALEKEQVRDFWMVSDKGMLFFRAQKTKSYKCTETVDECLWLVMEMRLDLGLCLK